MRNLFSWIYWLFHTPTKKYEYELKPFLGKQPLRLDSTNIPEDYVSHTLQQDKQYYSPNIK